MITINWVILSILTGIFFGLQTVFIKILSKSLHSFQILQYLFLIAGALLLPFLFFVEFRIDISNFLTALFISFVINVVAFYLLAKAIEISPVSLVMPFVGLTPLFLTISGSLILNEHITSMKFTGIILIVIGGFVLQIPENIKNKEDSFFHQFINIKEKGIRYVIIVAFLWSISASVEKIAVKASSPEIYGVTIHLILGLAFFILARRVKNQPKAGQGKGNKIFLLFCILGLVSALLALCQLTAIKFAYVTYVISFKRAGVLLSSLIGFIYFKEKNYFKTISGTICIIFGAFIITFA